MCPKTTSGCLTGIFKEQFSGDAWSFFKAKNLSVLDLKERACFLGHSTRSGQDVLQ